MGPPINFMREAGWFPVDSPTCDGGNLGTRRHWHIARPSMEVRYLVDPKNVIVNLENPQTSQVNGGKSTEKTWTHVWNQANIYIVNNYTMVSGQCFVIRGWDYLRIWTTNHVLGNLVFPCLVHFTDKKHKLKPRESSSQSANAERSGLILHCSILIVFVC